VAEAHPSVGIVSAYALEGVKVLLDGLPYPSTFIPGREICRKSLLGGPYVFGTPTSLLIRSDIVRQKESFYDESNIHADLEVCFELLMDNDFGFVHQVLTCTRTQEESTATRMRDLESYILGILTIIVRYGPICLTRQEYELMLERRLKKYYQVLAKSFLRLRDKKFWDYHQGRLRDLKVPLEWPRLAKAVAREVLESFTRPLDVLDGVLNWWPRAFQRRRSKDAR
jgi:hypothetical protein